MELYSHFTTRSSQYAANTALQWEGGTQTYQQLAHHANLIGHYLKTRFPEERGHISMLVPNTPFFFSALYGILGAGHVVVPYNPLLTVDEVCTFVRHSDSVVLLYDPIMEEKALAIMEQTGVEAVSIATILATQSNALPALLPSTTPEETCMILYTSGTTGDPKGVMLSHANIYANVIGFNAILDLSEKETFVCTLPLFHVFAMTIVLFGSMHVGARVLLFPHFQPQKVLETFMHETNVLYIGVPPMLMMLARFAPKDAAETHRLKYVVSGGGPLPLDVVALFKERFGYEILEGYGLTETSPVVAVNHPDDNHIGTIGKHIPGIETEVRDEDGNPVATGEVGELCVKGPIVMQGYYKNERMTQAAFHPNGWFRTGDMAVINEEGYIKIVGRCKDLIVCGGENIYPREVEEHLLRLPGVMEAAVVGKPDRLRQEVPWAFVVLADEAKARITDSVLRKHCRAFLSDYKIPEGFTIVESLPKTATNKIQKEKIKATYFS